MFNFIDHIKNFSNLAKRVPMAAKLAKFPTVQFIAETRIINNVEINIILNDNFVLATAQDPTLPSGFATKHEDGRYFVYLSKFTYTHEDREAILHHEFVHILNGDLEHTTKRGIEHEVAADIGACILMGEKYPVMKMLKNLRKCYTDRYGSLFTYSMINELDKRYERVLDFDLDEYLEELPKEQRCA